MAEPAAVEVVPQPIGVGGEMEALRRFFPAAVTWEGTIHEGGMGSGTPAMRGIGRGTATVIQDGRWIAGDYEQDQLLDDGTFVLRWQLHWVAGWARRHRARLRLTWDASDPAVIRWRNEVTTGDGSWFVIEEYPIVPG